MTHSSCLPNCNSFLRGIRTATLIITALVTVAALPLVAAEEGHADHTTAIDHAAGMAQHTTPNTAASSGDGHAHDDSGHSPQSGIGDPEHADGGSDHSDGGSEHDHGSGLLAAIGRFHPMVVHFPIALIIVAAFLAALESVRTVAQPRVRGAALILTHLGAISAVVAALIGWSAWAQASYPDQAQTLDLHRWLGTTSAVVAFTASVCAGCSISRPARLWAWRISLWLGAAAVSVTGHFGASLVFGSNYAW